MDDKKLVQMFRDIIYYDTHQLKAKVKPTEGFDLTEIKGNKYTENKPLIEVEATLEDNYYVNEVYPLIYKDYPIENRFRVSRNIYELGIPPKKAMDQLTWYETYLELELDSPLIKDRIPYTYNLPLYYKNDFIDIQGKLPEIQFFRIIFFNDGFKQVFKIIEFR